MTTPPEPWHLDKRVPVALILTILLQTGAAIWWAATTSARVTAIENNVAAVVISATATDSQVRALELAGERTSERLIAIQSSLVRIERILEERP